MTHEYVTANLLLHNCKNVAHAFVKIRDKLFIKGKDSDKLLLYATTDMFLSSVLMTACRDFVHSSVNEGTHKIIGSGGVQAKAQCWQSH